MFAQDTLFYGLCFKNALMRLIVTFTLHRKNTFLLPIFVQDTLAHREYRRNKFDYHRKIFTIFCSMNFKSNKSPVIK